MRDVFASRCRLSLVTPSDFEPATFVPLLSSALGGGDVASLVITAPAPKIQSAAELLGPIAQARGVAALVHNDSRIAGRARADGIHVDTGLDDLRTAVETFGARKLIVGAGGVESRHEAMLAGQAEPDYVFFGRLDGDSGEAIFPRSIALAEWWSSMFVIPAVVMGGSLIASIREAAEAHVEFVMLGRAVWNHPAGPGAAVEEANRLLSDMGRTP